MKRILKSLVARIVQRDAVWAAVNGTAGRLFKFAERARAAGGVPTEPRSIIREAIPALFPDLVVRHGIFAGMKYPEAASVGSALFPKLLGSYEREVQPILEVAMKSRYTEVLDVGCAEGYYAVGLAMRIPTARVYAFDTDPRAVDLCRRMAALNGVSERVVTSSRCDAETLKSVPFTGKALIVCDCEGCERDLFSPDVLPALLGHDVLVELHDFLDIEISSNIRTLFERSHDIRVIDSLDDIRKAHTYEYEELEPFDLATRRVLLGEYRPAMMQWYFMEPKAR
jgi:SAM-dependent methyltransferase